MSDVAFFPLAEPRDLGSHVHQLYNEFGQRKDMGKSAPAEDRPHFFLVRTFLGENDLLVILNTKKCRFRCGFCTLPDKSSKKWIADEDVIEQFRYVATELRHTLSIIDRVTLSNEGSILDTTTVGPAAIKEIVRAIGTMRRVRLIEVETRLEFVQADALQQLATLAPRAQIGILTGFETLNKNIRDRILTKGEPLGKFLRGLDVVAKNASSLTAYVLFKPDPAMSDPEACEEATASIRFLAKECSKRELPLTIRLNPMYKAAGSVWAKRADSGVAYLPPRLTDVMRVAEESTREGTRIYVGLSTEGLAEEGGSYPVRADFTPRLIKYVKLFNDGKLDRFPWDEIQRATA